MENQKNQTLRETLLEISKRYEEMTAKALLNEDFSMRDKLKDIPTLLKIVHFMDTDNKELKAKLQAIQNALNETINGIKD